MIGFQLRTGEPEDECWLFDAYKDAMQPHVEEAWGWDEKFQRNGFLEHLPGSSWIVVRYKHRDIGGYVLKTREDHFWLEMIIVLPRYRSQGIGSRIVEHIQGMADPVQLSVFKSSPAVKFYAELGFVQKDVDEHTYKMEWIREI